MKRMMVVMAVVMLLTVALSAGVADAWGGGGYGPNGQVYIVQRGDTLSGIAFQFGVSVYELGRINGIFNPNLIWAGQCLILPQPRPYWGGGYGTPTNWGGYNNCGQGCYGGYNQGYNNCGQGCYGGYQGYGQPTGWGYGNGSWGNYGYGGCSTCGQSGVPIPYGFQQESITLENNFSTTFEKG